MGTIQFNRNIANGVNIVRVDDVMQLQIVGPERMEEFHAMIDGYLNCRPEAPRWLFEMSDAINPVPIPERRKSGNAHN